MCCRRAATTTLVSLFFSQRAASLAAGGERERPDPNPQTPLNPSLPSPPLPSPAHHHRLAVAGKWVDAAATIAVPDPLNGEPFTLVPDTQGDAELAPFAEGLRRVPKSGLHNPLKNPERCARAPVALLC